MPDCEWVRCIQYNIWGGAAVVYNMDKSTQTEWTWFQEAYAKLPSHQEELQPEIVVQEPDATTSDKTNSFENLETSCNNTDNDDTSHSADDPIISNNCIESMDQLMEDLHITDDDSNDEDDNGGGLSDGDSDSVSPVQPYELPEKGLPWPKLLQYLRESEAASSKYFSIPVATRQSEKSNTNKRHEKESNDMTINDARIDEEICCFCGKQLMKIEMEGDEEPRFCCNDNKEFCILKAIYTKKMMDDKLKRKPGKITIVDSKVKFVKTPEERAWERIRRKQKYEENERARQRMLENSKYDHSTTHKTRMIHFSLSSPAILTEKWTKKPNPPPSIIKKSRLLTPLHSTHLAQLSDDVLETISNQSQQPHKTKQPSLKIEKGATTGRLLTVRLTDNTGQYYYSGSGNMAIICSPLFASVFSYYLFDDLKKGNILGYFDELGRGWLNKCDQSIRFLCSFSEIFIFDHHGRVKRFLLSDTATVNESLPMIFKINRYLSVKYNSHNDVLITLNSEQQQYKFRVQRKTSKAGIPQVDKKATYHNMQLEKMKLRFMSHLDCFEKVAKQMKTVPLPAIDTRSSQKYNKKEVKLAQNRQ